MGERQKNHTNKQPLSSLLGEQLTCSAFTAWVVPGSFGTSPCPKSVSLQSKSNSGCFLPIVFLACEELRQFQTTLLLPNAAEYMGLWSYRRSSQQTQCLEISERRGLGFFPPPALGSLSNQRWLGWLLVPISLCASACSAATPKDIFPFSGERSRSFLQRAV